MVATHRREIGTRGQGDSHDITDLVAHAVTQSKCDAGLATVFVVGSTAGVTTIEYSLARSPISIASSTTRLREKPNIGTISGGATTTDRATFARRCWGRR